MLRSPRGKSPRGGTDNEQSAHIAKLEAENARLRLECSALLEQNRSLRRHAEGGDGGGHDARDDEIVFLRRRLANIRALVERHREVKGTTKGTTPTVEGGSGLSSSFPGIKLRSETVLKKAPRLGAHSVQGK